MHSSSPKADAFHSSVKLCRVIRPFKGIVPLKIVVYPQKYDLKMTAGMCDCLWYLYSPAVCKMTTRVVAADFEKAPQEGVGFIAHQTTRIDSCLAYIETKIIIQNLVQQPSAIYLSSKRLRKGTL